MSDRCAEGLGRDVPKHRPVNLRGTSLSCDHTFRYSINSKQGATAKNRWLRITYLKTGHSVFAFVCYTKVSYRKKMIRIIDFTFGNAEISTKMSDRVRSVKISLDFSTNRLTRTFTWSSCWLIADMMSRTATTRRDSTPGTREGIPSRHTWHPVET